MTDGNQAKILYKAALAIPTVRINTRLQIAGTVYHLSKKKKPILATTEDKGNRKVGNHLKAGGCEARIALGQNTFHSQEEGLLDLDRMGTAIMAVCRRMLHTIRAANGRVRLGEL